VCSWYNKNNNTNFQHRYNNNNNTLKIKCPKLHDKVLGQLGGWGHLKGHLKKGGLTSDQGEFLCRENSYRHLIKWAKNKRKKFETCFYHKILNLDGNILWKTNRSSSQLSKLRGPFSRIKWRHNSDNFFKVMCTRYGE
jgi:hypothetical protein